MSYFETADCARRASRAWERVAEITLPPTHVTGVGWLATAVDREGSPFGLMQSGG